MIRGGHRAWSRQLAGFSLLLALLLVARVTSGQEFLELKLEPVLGTIHRGDGSPGETLRVLAGADQVWLAAGDLSALLQCTLYWRPEVQKLSLEVGGHRLGFSVGSEVVQVDGEASVHLPGPVFNREGQIFLPLSAFLDASGRRYPWIPVALHWDGATRRLLVGAARPGLTGIQLFPVPNGERLELVFERPVEARVELAGRSRTVVRLPELALDPDTLTLPTTGERFLALTAETALSGAALSFATTPEILGYSVQRLERPPRVVIELTDDPEAIRERRFRAFPESGLADTLAVAVIALDPGAGAPGGDDPDGGALSLGLALALARRLEDSLGVRVVLTRDTTRPVSDADRSEIANTARADIFLSLHYNRDPAAPRAIIAKPASRRYLGVARPLAELGFESWGQGSRRTSEASRLLAGLLVAEIRQELGLDGGGRDFEERAAPREGAAELEEGTVVEWPVPLLQAAVMPAVYLVVEDLAASAAASNDPHRTERLTAAILRAIQRYRLSGP